MGSYEVVTEQILRLLERGVAPWRQPWDGAAEMARNLVSGRRYHGVNAFVLHAARIKRGYRSTWWATFDQARGLRGHIRKGERATKIIYWEWASVPEEQPEPAGGQPEPRPGRGPLLRFFNVFNVEQCDRLEAKIPAASPAAVEPIAAATRIVTDMPNPPAIHHGDPAAFYRPADDSIHLPAPGGFRSAQAYYATLFHELAHATGHPRRLGRFGLDMAVPPFGSPDYSREELTAEMAAAFLCGEVSISAATVEQSTSYIANWLRVLGRDPRAVVVAGSGAQKAADHILGRASGPQVASPNRG
jgi:antirestriction protein ArdC